MQTTHRAEPTLYPHMLRTIEPDHLSDIIYLFDSIIPILGEMPCQEWHFKGFQNVPTFSNWLVILVKCCLFVLLLAFVYYIEVKHILHQHC